MPVALLEVAQQPAEAARLYGLQLRLQGIQVARESDRLPSWK